MHSLVMIIIYRYITNSQNDQLPDGLIAQLIEHWAGIADVKIWHPSKVPFSRAFPKVLQGVWHVIAWCTNVTNMLARDSVILLLSAIKMVNTDLFTSSLVHLRRPVEPKKCFMLSRIVMFVKEPSVCCSDRFISFAKHCWTEDFEDDYFKQKIGIIPHLRPLDLQGELISIEFYLMGC